MAEPKRYGPSRGLTLEEIEKQCRGYGPGYQYSIGSGTAMALVAEIRRLQGKMNDLSWEIAGALEDFDAMGAMDDVCLTTLRRVEETLAIESRGEEVSNTES